MKTYALRRFLLIIPTLFLVSFLVFLAVRLIPGDIIDLMIQESVRFTEAERAVLEHELGLDVPFLTQYGRWVGVWPQAGGGFSGIFQGDLGNSLWSNTPVVDEIVNRMPVTVELGILALLTSTIIALPIGVYSAIR